MDQERIKSNRPPKRGGGASFTPVEIEKIETEDVMSKVDSALASAKTLKRDVDQRIREREEPRRVCGC